jgi:hypothetical protein
VAVALVASASGLAANHPALFGPPGVAEAALYWNWATRLAAQLGIVYAIGRLRAATARPGAQATVVTSVAADGTPRSRTRSTSPGS